MKILFNCLSMEKGGTERVISTLANSLISNHEISIITLKNSDVLYNLNKNIKLLKIEKNKFKKHNKAFKIISKLSLKSFFKLSKVIKDEKPDVIISFLPEPSLKLMLLNLIDSKIKKIPIIVSIRNNPVTEYSNKIIYFIMKRLYKNVNGLVLQTEDAKKYFENIIKDENKMIVIPNPINNKFIVDKPYSGNRDKTIVNVGRLENQKNQKLLIDAFAMVAKKHSEYKLQIYGAGKLLEELKEQTKKNQIENLVEFMGQVDDLENKIYKAGIFVLSSDYEGMPNALMEAMALGLPCISTDCPCGGARMLIKNEENGLLVKTSDKKDMAKAINRLIEDKELSKKISNSSYKIKDEYSIENIKAKWLNFIERVK